MSVKMRQQVERRIASVFIRDALAAGYTIDVFDSEETVLENSASRKEILAAMFTTDDDKLILRKDGYYVGWVWFIYGNDGWDVVSDYTTNLKHLMAGARKMSARYQ